MQSFIITRIQFSIQHIVTRTIQHSQGLSLNELVVDPTIFLKNGLSYIFLSLIQIKEKIILLVILQHENIYVNPRVNIEMNKLNTNAT